MNAATGRVYLLIGWLAVGGGLSAAEDAPDAWQAGAPVFSETGPPRSPRPILLYFTAPWCGFCQQMQRTTLAEPAVLAGLSRLRAHTLDFDTAGELAKRFAVRGIPAFVMTNDRGEVIDRLSGARSAAQFLGWLNRAGSEAARSAKTAEVLAEKLRALPAEARADDAATRAAAVALLWNLAGRAEDADRAEAGQILAALLAEPARDTILSVGLANPDLAVRVVAAKLLEQSSAGKRTFDPWADEDARSQALAGLGLLK